MLELHIKHGERHVSPFDLPTVLGAEAAAVEVGHAIEVLIDFLDELSGDPDEETGSDSEDDFVLSPRAALGIGGHPGCPISDPDLAAGKLKSRKVGRRRLIDAQSLRELVGAHAR